MTTEAAPPGRIVRLRPATMADAEFVLAWANDPDTRAASFHSAAIGREEHERWLVRVLDNPERALLIAELEDLPIAVVRLDRRAIGVAELSLNLAPEQRGRRLSSPILIAAIDRARALGYGRLVACIRPGNERSRRTFATAGFQPTGREVVAGQEALQYELRLGEG